MKKISAIILGICVLVGCSTEDPFTELKEKAEVFELGGAKKLQLTKDPGFSIGSYETFNNIGDVTADAEGRFFVINNHRARIEVFSRQGEHLRSLGRSGSDPGEFQNPVQLQTDAQFLYVFDKDLQQLNLFRLNDLEVEGAINLNAAHLFSADSLQTAIPFTFELLSENAVMVGFRITKSPQDQQELYVKVGKEGKLIGEPLFRFKGKSLYVDDTMTTTVIMELPYAPETLIKTSADASIYVLNTSDFLIRKLNQDAKFQEARYYPMEKRPLNKQDVVDSYTNVYYRRAIRAATLPATWPAVDHFLTDDEGRIWVATIIAQPDQFRWYVLDDSGSPLYTFDLPRTETILLIKDHRVYVRRFNSRGYSDEILRYRFDED